jgi:thiosulfate/3-mercaptopyruvate sulfurtransferase
VTDVPRGTRARSRSELATTTVQLLHGAWLEPERCHYRLEMALIGVGELAARIERGDDDLVICDVRFDLRDHERGRALHARGHLPGAVFVDLHSDLAIHDGSSPSGGGRHPLPPTARFGELLGHLGIAPDTFVVAYDDMGGAFAARLWWMLRAIGHEHVAVLDGGLPAWERAGHPIDTSVIDRRTSSYPVPARWPGIVSADDVTTAIEAGRTVIDARAAERFRGEVEPLDPRAGHIPGAINLPHADNLAADGLHLPVADLRDRFRDIDTTSQPIVYCGSGVSACHNMLVMCLLGLAEPSEALLYPGSWSEWSSDSSRPLATGD